MSYAIRLDRRTQTIGRGADNGIVLNDPSVSRHHCSIRWEDSVYVLYDHNSAGGTLVNGVAVTRHVLKHGDTLKLGQTVLKWQDDELLIPEPALGRMRRLGPGAAGAPIVAGLMVVFVFLWALLGRSPTLPSKATATPEVSSPLPAITDTAAPSGGISTSATPKVPRTPTGTPTPVVVSTLTATPAKGPTTSSTPTGSTTPTNTHTPTATATPSPTATTTATMTPTPSGTRPSDTPRPIITVTKTPGPVY